MAKRSWDQLPAVLLASAASWLADAKSLSCIHSTCRAWNGNAKLDTLWKQVFDQEWHGFADNNSGLSLDGALMPWRKRVTAYKAAETNLRAERFSETVFADDYICQFDQLVELEIVSALNSLACITEDEVVLLSLPSCKELRRWSLPERCRLAKVKADGANLAVGFPSGKVRVWDAASGAAVGRVVQLESQEQPSGLDLSGDVLAVAGSTTVTLWRVSTGERLRNLALLLPVWRIGLHHDASSGTVRLFTHVGQIASHVIMSLNGAADVLEQVTAQDTRGDRVLRFDARNGVAYSCDARQVQRWQPGKQQREFKAIDLQSFSAQYRQQYLLRGSWLLCAASASLLVVETERAHSWRVTPPQMKRAESWLCNWHFLIARESSAIRVFDCLPARK